MQQVDDAQSLFALRCSALMADADIAGAVRWGAGGGGGRLRVFLGLGNVHSWASAAGIVSLGGCESRDGLVVVEVVVEDEFFYRVAGWGWRWGDGAGVVWLLSEMALLKQSRRVALIKFDFFLGIFWVPCLALFHNSAVVEATTSSVGLTECLRRRLGPSPTVDPPKLRST